jgi:hypothetical protein
MSIFNPLKIPCKNPQWLNKNFHLLYQPTKKNSQSKRSLKYHTDTKSHQKSSKSHLSANIGFSDVWLTCSQFTTKYVSGIVKIILYTHAEKSREGESHEKRKHKQSQLFITFRWNNKTWNAESIFLPSIRKNRLCL